MEPRLELCGVHSGCQLSLFGSANCQCRDCKSHSYSCSESHVFLTDINGERHPWASRADNQTQITKGLAISATHWLLRMLHCRRPELQASHGPGYIHWPAAMLPSMQEC